MNCLLFVAQDHLSFLPPPVFSAGVMCLKGREYRSAKHEEEKEKSRKEGEKFSGRNFFCSSEFLFSPVL